MIQELSCLPFPLTSLHQSSSLTGFEYQMGYKNLLQWGMLVLQQRKLRFDHRNQKGKILGSYIIILLRFIKKFPDTFLESISEDF